MIKHEEKKCPRCHAPFECKVGSIVLCQCSAVKLNDDERHYMQQCFNDCLCASCMKEMKSEFQLHRFKTRLKRLLRMS
ncbi:cysteine-rich CWC family protein [Chryseolinea lacunae]|uniref:Cysteine-rich CWC family protein n=1 Tax=Chryseolinea lacunae TaxID=2801331 RepID=A0ABS1KLW9_9BACT|nr:cysteine-rich CWC family protein [Chryseolinea lacunae]MBL0740329.1 cysteine-rich CWC family protein [Chryseolinea lacunae]